MIRAGQCSEGDREGEGRVRERRVIGAGQCSEGDREGEGRVRGRGE